MNTIISLGSNSPAPPGADGAGIPAVSQDGAPLQGPAKPFQTALQDALAQDSGQGAGASLDEAALAALLAQRQPGAAATGNGLPPANGESATAESAPPQTVPGPTMLLEIPVAPAVPATPPVMPLATPETVAAARTGAAGGEPPQKATAVRAPAGALPISTAIQAALGELTSPADSAKAQPGLLVPVGDPAKAETLTALPSVVSALSAATASSSASGAAPFSLAALSSAPPLAEPAAAAGVSLPVQHPRWGEVLGERVVWMVGNLNSSAQLSLNPPELGPLEVRITVDKNDAQVSFISAHGTVRDAVEAALPRLRELLAQAGMNLTDANVSAHAHARGSGGEARGQTGSGGAAASGDEQGTSASESRNTVRGLVDLYA